MKKTLLLFLFTITFSINAQNPADIDLVIGSGFVGFHNVNNIAVQPDGKIVVGGSLLDSGGGQATKYKVVRLNSNGSIDSGFTVANFSQNADVGDIVIQPDGKILIGGNFRKMNNQDVGTLVRLNADGSKDTSFSETVYNTISSIALQADGKIVLGGTGLFIVNGHQQKSMVRLNADGTIDNSFDFGGLGFLPINMSNTVYKVVVQPDGKILAGGFFANFGGQLQGKLVRLNSNGTKDTTFDIGIGSTDGGIISDIDLQPDGKILICGGFGAWNGQPFGHLCRLNANGSIDLSFTNMFNAYIYPVLEIVHQTDGKIIAIGDYEFDAGVIKRIHRFNSDGTLDTSFNVDVDNSLYGLAIQADNKVLIGGFMSWEKSNTLKNGMARLNLNGTRDTTFSQSTGLNDDVFSIALQDDHKTLLAGSFTNFNGSVQNRILRVNNDGSKDSSFAIGSGFNDSVKSVAVQTDGKIIIGGSFTEFNGQPANRLIRLNNNGTKDMSFNIAAGFNNTVQIIQLQTDGKILVGGLFTDLNGTPIRYLVRLNTDGSPDTGFSAVSGFNGGITSIAIQPDGKIVAGGSFTLFNGETQNRLIRLNANGTRDNTIEFGNTFIHVDVADIALQSDGKIIATGYLGIFRFNADGSLDENFNINTHSLNLFQVNTVAIAPNGKMVVGGSFNAIGNRTNRIIRINSDGTKDTVFDPGNLIDGSNDTFSSGFTEGSCNDIVLQADDKIWAGGSFFHYRGISSFSAIRLAGDAILGVDNPDLNTKIKVYPNPVKDYLNLNTVAKSVKIYDIRGIFLTEFENTDKLDFNGYSQGIYLITIELENGSTETRKVIKS